MNHNKSYRKLGRRSDHRLAMLKNMTISLMKSFQKKEMRGKMRNILYLQ